MGTLCPTPPTAHVTPHRTSLALHPPQTRSTMPCPLVVNEFGTGVSHYVSPSLASFAPQPPHKTVNARRLPWSGGFDRIFRNEEVAGSNPASSTERPRQGDLGERVRSLDSDPVVCGAPQSLHGIGRRSTSFSARAVNVERLES